MLGMEREEFIEGLKTRTKQFAIRILKLYQALPKTHDYQIVGKQLIRSGTSVASNYRAACRARSQNEFFSKISIVVEEADETAFWLEVLIESEMMSQEKLDLLLKETLELTKIMATARKNSKKQ